MYEIIILPPTERFIKSLKKGEQTKLFNVIDELSESPRLGKELVGRLSGLRSRRIGIYRIIYRIEEAQLVIFVLRAGYRKNIYSKNIGK